MGYINASYAHGCNLNDGTDGFIRVTILNTSTGIGAVDITIYRGPIGDNIVVATYSLNLSAETSHKFDGLSDDSYTVQILASDGETMRTNTQTVNCEAIVLPADDGEDPKNIKVQWDYYGPTVVSIDGVTKWQYNVEIRRFSVDKEQLFWQKFTKIVEPNTSYASGLVHPDIPFYGYCVPATTTRWQWFYTGRNGIAQKGVDFYSTLCGYAQVLGCTDPDATNYNPNATKDDGTCYYRPQVLGCTDPRATNYNPNATDENGTCVYAPDTVEAIFVVSPVNSIRFVATENVDGITTMQNPDNVLYCNEKYQIGFSNQPYYQQVCKADPHTYQMLSNYTTVAMTLHNYPSGQLVASFTPTVKEQFTGDSDFFAAYLKNNTNGQTRIYFNTGDIPAPVGIGDVLTIANSSTFDGTYAIIDIKQDIKLEAPYVVINRPFGSGDTAVPADVQFHLAVADYDVLEQNIDWSLYPEGLYEMRIAATDPTHGNRTYISEPVNLKTQHPNTLLFEYRNYDNAFDIVYTTGIVNRIRVSGEIRERLGGGMDEIHREPMNKLTRLRGVAQRRFRMNLRMLPPYLHEKISVIMRHDFIRINGVEYQSEEGYGEPEYNGSSLADSATVIEQVEWFKAHNDHDIGSINQTPLLIVNGGFLRL